MPATRCTTAFAAAAITTGLTVSLTAWTAPATAATQVGIYDNCTQLNKKYPHGVGRAKARDMTSGTPVTTFKRSTKLYNAADRANGGLDRDNDGIACEKA